MGKAFPGQGWRPPSARQQNGWDESAEFYALKKRLSDKLPDQRMPLPTELDVIAVRNSTGGDRLASEVVELYHEIIDQPTRLHPWLDAIQLTSRCARYGVLRWATPQNEIDWCQVSGPTFALVDLTLGHKRCSPKKELYHFVGDDDGPIEILWKPMDAESGVHECIVELEQVVPPSTYVVKIPDGQTLPARVGLIVGRKEFDIYKVVPHDYTNDEPELKSLEEITKPDGSKLRKEIYNMSLRAIRACGDDLYLPIHREECGNWLISESVPRNTWYTARLVNPLCPDQLGSHAITDVEPVESPESQTVLDGITHAINKFGRAALDGDLILIMRKIRLPDDSGSGSGSGSNPELESGSGPGPGSGSFSGSSGSGGCEDDFLITTVFAQCRDVPVALESSCVEGSGSGILSESAPMGDGRFLFRIDCGSGSGSGESAGSGSAEGCPPITASVQRKVALETCTRDPDIVEQLELEMQDVLANMSMNPCPKWVNAVICVFPSCIPETEEEAECEPVCPEGSDSASGS